jgi:hypothetical protein
MLPIPEHVKNYSFDIQRNVYRYLYQLDERHCVAYRIAFDHLGQLFHITKSNGYLEWLKKNS